jgi:nitrate/nitrite transporter NarK
MGYYTDTTSVNNRGKLGGITMLISGLGIFLFGVINIEDILLRVVVLSIWRFSGLALFLRNKPNQENVNKEGKQKNLSYKTIFGQRPFILYFIPWIMFSLLTYLSTPIRLDFLEIQHAQYLPLIANGLFGLFAIVGGFLSDAVGRKRVTTVGFVILGLAYAIVGTFPGQLASWYFHTVADAVAWGFFFVVFVITIWGDLSYELPSDKYYAVGLLPFFISKFLQLTVEGSIIGSIAPSAIFSFTALFLFLAVLPLIYAPETLPEKHMRERELKSYIEKAKKEAEKAQKKEEETPQEEDEGAEVEFEANQKDYEEALKEAEKYY